MRKYLLLLMLLATPASAGSLQFNTFGGGWCTVNPGLNASTVVCDESLGYSPRRLRFVRQRTLMQLGPRGGLKCATIDLYDPSIPTIREGRILETHTQCYR